MLVLWPFAVRDNVIAANRQDHDIHNKVAVWGYFGEIASVLVCFIRVLRRHALPCLFTDYQEHIRPSLRRPRHPRVEVAVQQQNVFSSPNETYLQICFSDPEPDPESVQRTVSSPNPQVQPFPRRVPAGRSRSTFAKSRAWSHPLPVVADEPTCKKIQMGGWQRCTVLRNGAQLSDLRYFCSTCVPFGFSLKKAWS